MNHRHWMFVCLVLVAAPLLGIDVDVICPGGGPDAYPSITAALADLPPDGPNTIRIDGVCVERVDIINRRQLTLMRHPSAAEATIQRPGAPIPFTLQILQSSVSMTNVTVQNAGVNVDGSTLVASNLRVQNSVGSGVLANGPSADVTLLSSTIEGSVRDGINSQSGARVTLQRTAVRNNGGSGIAVANASTHLVGLSAPFPNIIEDNTASGVRVHSTATLVLLGTNVIRDNDGKGLDVSLGSSVLWSVVGALSTSIENNALTGVDLSASSMDVAGAHRVSGNGTSGLWPGIHVGGGSRLQMAGGTQILGNTAEGVRVEYNAGISVSGSTISGNGGDGVAVLRLSSADFGTGNAFSGNSGASVRCDATALITGNTASIATLDCKNVEKK